MTALDFSRPKGLHIALWIAQALLGFVFIFNGITKTFPPIEQVATMAPWATQVPTGLVRFIGLSELLGGLGLILPALLRIKPVLTPWAATGLATVMVLALLFHISRGEYTMIAMNGVLTLIAAFIACGRFTKAPIYPKS